ncbi:MAG TPA: SWIM zinc finger family protein [Saprospiraceae bacterium]|nr:SWIM zinc finger family protein [Saprospiraceae bacterium]HMP23517.1 SWIM zinc finger family protein [Saprospiraceae bacterium]
MYWNAQQLAAFAPDTATLERARGIAQPFRWHDLAGNETIVWGEYKTAGDAPFHTVVHLHQPQCYCSCPSRRRPCKHVLALLLLCLQGSDSFRVWYDHPDWVEKWLQRIQKKAAAPAKTSSDWLPPAKTIEQMSAGVLELREWLLDLIRQGLAAALSHPPTFWNTFATRMTDAKLPGIARRVRSLATRTLSADAHEQLLSDIAELYLFVKAFQRNAQLSPDLQQEVFNQAGATIRKEDVLQQAAEQDTWYIAGQVEGEEDNLRYRRTWLLGQRTGHAALLLDFVWGNADFNEHWQVGTAIEAEIVFYPGASRSRALVKSFTNLAQVPPIAGYAHWESFAEGYAAAIAANPWGSIFPVLIDHVTPSLQEGQLQLIDKLGKQLVAKTTEEHTWRIIALSGGHPLQIFGEWRDTFFYPLTLLTDDGVISLI